LDPKTNLIFEFFFFDNMANEGDLDVDLNVYVDDDIAYGSVEGPDLEEWASFCIEGGFAWLSFGA
jgi:hypothetical protein